AGKLPMLGAKLTLRFLLPCKLLPASSLSSLPKICRLEADPGPCRGYLKRYFFNLSSMKCEKFIYGGCYGNDNNFQDEDSCVDSCLAKFGCVPMLPQFKITQWLLAGPSLCYSPKDEGLCSSSVTRYYYDSKSQSCEEFSYTGCGGNANNFVNKKNCYNICKKDSLRYKGTKPGLLLTKHGNSIWQTLGGY
uniref:Tissue factor pathway inhibitor 2 n=1 Tax=Chelonoidis abingdonii TaxID=106734 RepID=A0A8C0G0W1_CHEAB